MKSREEIIDGLNDEITVYTNEVIYKVSLYSLKEDLPKVGDIYKDKDDKEWKVTDIRQSNLIWTNPPSPFPRWDMTLKGYPANTLESKNNLTLNR